MTERQKEEFIEAGKSNAWKAATFCTSKANRDKYGGMVHCLATAWTFGMIESLAKDTVKYYACERPDVMDEVLGSYPTVKSVVFEVFECNG